MRKFYAYLIAFIILTLIILPTMTRSKNKSDIQEIVNANNAALFSITKTKGAFLSFDISSVPHDDEKYNIIFSLFLEYKNDAGEISEFLIYPVDVASRQIGNSGLAVKTKTQKDNFVNFVLPLDLFDKTTDKFGVVIFTSQNSNFLFAGADESTRSPKLVIEHKEGGRRNISEGSFDTELFKSEIQAKLESIQKDVKTAVTNSEKKWYEKPHFTISLGFILGILSSIAYSFLKRYFPFL